MTYIQRCLRCDAMQRCVMSHCQCHFRERIVPQSAPARDEISMLATKINHGKEDFEIIREKRLNKKIRFFSSSLKHRCSNLHFSPFQVCFFHFLSSLEHLGKLTLESVEVSRGVKFKPFYFSGDKKKVLAPHQSWGSTPKFGIQLKLDPEMPLSGFPVFRNTRNFFSDSLIPPR